MKLFINELIIEVIYDSAVQTENAVIIEAKDFAAFTEKLFNEEKYSHNQLRHYLLASCKKELKNILKSHFKIIKAAGGVVKNSQNKIIVIHRNEKWDIPKGKLEKGESFRYAAIREVSEECGIKEIDLLDKIVTTYHIYRHKKELILKKTKWYNMLSNHSAPFKPQIDEGITEAKWVETSFLKSKNIKTYKSILEVVSKLPF